MITITNFEEHVKQYGCDICFVCIHKLPICDHDQNDVCHTPVLCESCYEMGWIVCDCGSAAIWRCLKCNPLF